MANKQILNQPIETRLTIDGKALPTFYTLLADLVNLEILSGTGSPEGVEEADQKTLYMDESGVAGAILYIKRDADDGAGDRRFGWVLI